MKNGITVANRAVTHLTAIALSCAAPAKKKHITPTRTTRVFSISDERRLIFLPFTLPYMRYAARRGLESICQNRCEGVRCKSYHLGTSLVGKQDVAPRTVSPAVSAGCCQVSAEFQSSKPKRRRPTLAKTKIARVGHPPTEQGPRTSNGLTPEGVSYRSTTAAGIDPSATFKN
jgi:hypothetical protein